jgi:hypothetical protein
MRPLKSADTIPRPWISSSNNPVYIATIYLSRINFETILPFPLSLKSFMRVFLIIFKYALIFIRMFSVP